MRIAKNQIERDDAVARILEGAFLAIRKIQDVF